MTINERLFDELDKKRLSAAGLCKVLGIGTGQTTSWKQRGTDPPAKYIAKICEYLGCSVEYLLTGEESPKNCIKKEPIFGISENGQEMLRLYEQLSEREQLLLLGRLQQMVDPLFDTQGQNIEEKAM